MANSFFSRIIYSACNEDSESERKALQLDKNDTVLCITGSGARALDLLVDHPKKIISVDFNAAQNHLLAIKIAAYQSFSYEEFKSFIGLNTNGNRTALYSKLSPLLSGEVKSYWDKNFKLIEQGLLYCGAWESIQRGMSKAAFFRKKKINKLLSFSTVENQKIYWEKVWKNGTWKFFMKIICNKFLWTKIIREPGALLIPKDFDVYNYLNSRLDFMANNHLLKTNHFANLLFFGEYKENCLLPLHLRKENFEILKSQVNKIEIVTDTLINVIENQSPEKLVTAYSLSDFSSYAPIEMYTAIWKKLTIHSKPNAKFCERFFLVKRNPEKDNPSIKRDSELESRLMNEDLTSIYTFSAGTIN